MDNLWLTLHIFRLSDNALVYYVFKCPEFLIITFEVFVKQVCDSNMDGSKVLRSKENYGQFVTYSPYISFEW